MQVEHVAGVGLPPGRAVQQQAQLAISHRVAGQVIINDQHMLALIHQVFAHGGAGVGRDVQHGRRVGGLGADHDAVIHGSQLPQLGDDARYGGLLLADGHIDADDVLALLVDNRVNGNGSLACLSVADDQLTLAPADGHQGVDGLDAGLQRHRHRLSGDDAGGRAFHRSGVGSQQCAAAVHRAAQAVYHAADQLLAHRHLHHLPGAAYLGALVQFLIAAQQHGADGVLLNVHHHAPQAAVKLQHLACHHVGQAGNAADAVRQTEHLAGLEAARLFIRRGQLLLEIDRQVLAGVLLALQFLIQPVQHIGKAAVIHRVAQLQAQAADQALLCSCFKVHRGAGLALHQGAHLPGDLRVDLLRPGQGGLQALAPAQAGPVAVGQRQLLLQGIQEARRHSLAGLGIICPLQQLSGLCQNVRRLFVPELPQHLTLHAQCVLPGLLPAALRQFLPGLGTLAETLRRALSGLAHNLLALGLALRPNILKGLCNMLCVLPRRLCRVQGVTDLLAVAVDHVDNHLFAEFHQHKGQYGKVDQRVNNVPSAQLQSPSFLYFLIFPLIG